MASSASPRSERPRSIVKRCVRTPWTDIAFPALMIIGLAGVLGAESLQAISIGASATMLALHGAAVLPMRLLADSPTVYWVWGPALAAGLVFQSIVGYATIGGLEISSVTVFVAMSPLAVRGVIRIAQRTVDEVSIVGPLLAFGLVLIALGPFSRAALAAGLLLSGLTIAQSEDLRGPRRATRPRWAHRTRHLPGVAVLAMLLIARSRNSVAIPDTWTLHGEAMALGLTDATGTAWLYTPSLTYHWLGSLWLGIQIRALGLDPLIGSMILTPLVAALGGVMCLLAAATRRDRPTTLWPALAVVATMCTASASEPLRHSIDGQVSNQLGYLVLVASAAVLLSALGGAASPTSGLLTALAFGFVLGATKFPLAVVLGGAIAAWAVAATRGSARQRRLRSSGWTNAFVPIGWYVGTGVAYLMLAGGDETTGRVSLLSPFAGSQILRPPSLGTWGFSFSSTLPGLAGLVILLVAARTPTLLMFATRQDTERHADRLLVAFGLGALAAGSLTVWTRFVGEQSLYFLGGAFTTIGVAVAVTVPNFGAAARPSGEILCSAAFIAALTGAARVGIDVLRRVDEPNVSSLGWYLLVMALGVIGLIAIWPPSIPDGRRRQLRLFAACGVVLSGLAVYSAGLASEDLVDRVLGATTTLQDHAPDELERSVALAADEIRRRSTPSDVVASNYVCSPGRCDMPTHLVAVVTQRTLLWEAAGPAVPFPHLDPMKRVDDGYQRRNLSTLIARPPSVDLALRLNRAGVAWVLASRETDDGTAQRECRQAPRPFRCVWWDEYSFVLQIEGR